jgi:hypothetical protein
MDIWARVLLGLFYGGNVRFKSFEDMEGCLEDSNFGAQLLRTFWEL